MALLFPADTAILVACGLVVFGSVGYAVVLIVRGFFSE